MARGRRGRAVKRAAIQRGIDAAAEERQASWRRGGEPNVTAAVTVELNGPEHVSRPEGLFAKKREVAR